jgi:hypothetical protein
VSDGHAVQSADLVDVRLPVPPVERLDDETRWDLGVVEATNVDVPAVWMRPRAVEGMDAAMPVLNV